MAKTTNLGALGRMGTIDPVTVRDHSKSLRSASIEASNQSSANSLVYSFFGDQLDQPDPIGRLGIGSRGGRQRRQHKNDDSSEGSQHSPDYLCSSGSTSGSTTTNALLEAPCSLKPSASTSCLLTSNEDSQSTSSSNTLVCIPTRASLTHEWKRLKTPNKCRECNLLVYFNGRECSFCGFVAHKKCVTILVIKCSGQQVCGSKSKQLARRQQAASSGASTRPVAQPIFGQPINDNGPKVVDFVKRFIYEIDTRGLTSRGIYRVSSIKSKVDRLCNYYDQNISSLIDLSSFHPNIIANALKMFLRQLPEPLLTHQLYNEFIDIAKKYPKSKTTNTETTIASTKQPQHNRQANIAGPAAAAAPSYLMAARTKRSLVATQLENPSTNQRRDYDPMLIVELSEIIELLPAVNLQLIALLMRHLKRVADMSEENQMSATNLSIIFGPTLLNADNKSLAIVDNIHQARAIELLILWADKIFPQFDNYESKAVIELDFTELELEQQRQRELEREQQALMLLRAHEKEAKKKGQSRCNCPHHINSRDHEPTSAQAKLTATAVANNNNDNKDQDQWPKTRIELMELRRQFFTLPTTQADLVDRQGTTKSTESVIHNHQAGDGASITRPANDTGKHRNSSAGNNSNNSSDAPKRSSPSLPMIKVQSHDASNNDSNLRLFRRQ